MTMINGTMGPAAAAGLEPTHGLTPDMLMVYCSTRIGGLDQEIDRHFEKQQVIRAAQGALNRLQGAFNKYIADQGYGTKIGDNERPPNHLATLEIDGAFEEALKALPADSPQRAELEAVRKTFRENTHASFGGDNKASTEELTAWLKGVSAASDALTKGGELDMMQLQSLMSQRQTAIQLTTNLISSLGESQKAIAAKIGS